MEIGDEFIQNPADDRIAYAESLNRWMQSILLWCIIIWTRDCIPLWQMVSYVIRTVMLTLQFVRCHSTFNPT